MRITAEVQNSDSISVTVTMTMTIGEWKQLSDQMPQRWPAFKLHEAIQSAVRKIERAVVEDVGKEA